MPKNGVSGRAEGGCERKERRLSGTTGELGTEDVRIPVQEAHLPTTPGFCLHLRVHKSQGVEPRSDSFHTLPAAD